MPQTDRETSLFRYALFWAWFGILYNVIEGIVSTYLGAQEETLALFGFGVDSFIEAISAVGIMQMVSRIRRDPDSHRGSFEATALRITGVCFYFLAVGLVLGAIATLITGSTPETSRSSVTIAVISIAIMWVMLREKLRIGRELDSAAMIADARCTQVCIWMSLVLLVSGGIFAATGFGWIDAVGSLGLAYFSVIEGKEALEKAAGTHDCGCSH